MEERTIHYICNDVQYYDRTKDGISMNERSFINFCRDLVREYGTNVGNNIFLTLDDLPRSMQHQYLKQWYFFEGYIERYQEIFNNPSKIDAAIEEERDDLNYWLSQYVEEIEQERFSEYLYDNDLCVLHHENNGEPFIIRR